MIKMNERIYPNHVAMILDGNRRWAKEKGLPQLKGHQAGFENIIDLAPYIVEKGVKVLSVYAFSTENFKRTEEEVSYLMDIFMNMFRKECNKIHKENIKIVVSGRKELLRKDVQEAIKYVEDLTKDNTKAIFNVCLAYGGQQEIVDGIKRVVKDVQDGKLNIDEFNEQTMYKYMYNELPPVDLLIRTSGELRLSNYLLYQMSYAEMYFPNVYFPAFDRNEFEKAIDIYNSRDRRFGGNTKDEKKSN
jgi:undecaprenyl diphosphate synthase